MNIRNIPVLGGTLPFGAQRTAGKLAGFALRNATGSLSRRHLDVGCGNGYITRIVGSRFDLSIGIDVEPQRLSQFQKNVDRTKFSALEMSASSLAFRDESFCLVTAFEVLEHVPDLQACVSEMTRVCRAGGMVVVSVPQVWFPFENHGAQISGRIVEGKIPLLPYIRPLHRRWALARIFSSAEMDCLFSRLIPISTAYATPQFERSQARAGGWERNLRKLGGMLDKFESVPILREFFGVSMLKAYKKPDLASAETQD